MAYPPPDPRSFNPGVMKDYARSRRREMKDSWSGSCSLRFRRFPRLGLVRRWFSRIRRR